MSDLALTLPDETLELLAERVAELLSDQRPAKIDDGYLNVAGAAAFLSCPLSRIYALVSARRIPHEKDGSRLLFDRSALRAWVRAGGGRRP